jgi:hypothetical protein
MRSVSANAFIKRLFRSTMHGIHWGRWRYGFLRSHLHSSMISVYSHHLLVHRWHGYSLEYIKSGIP